MAGFSDRNEIKKSASGRNGIGEESRNGHGADRFCIMAASDLHYLSPQLMEYSGEFRKMCEAIQEPEMERIEEITDALLENVLQQKPDVFLVTGDLSYQGEKLSHIGLADKLDRLVRAGIRVYVVPGNQDVENPFSMCWRTDGEKGYTAAESVSAREFVRIYCHMGYDENDSSIVSRAPDSLSYQVRLYKGRKTSPQQADRVQEVQKSTVQRQALCIFMLDTTIFQSPQGQVASGTLAWLEKRLQEKGGGENVCLIAGHHPMLSDSREMEDYTLKNGRELSQLMWKYQIPFYVSGHLHRAGAVQAPERGNLLGKWIRRFARGCRRNISTAPVNIYLEKRGLRDVILQERTEQYGKAE